MPPPRAGWGTDVSESSVAAASGTPTRTFVLVHGGFHGGWCWAKAAALLRANGHTVYTPTQTGCGERSHLLSAAITMDTFVDDIANVLLWEDLYDVVLVGHSFGGIAISGVADRLPARVRLLVYLDSLIVPGGKSAFDQLDPEVVQSRIEAARATGGLAIPAPPAALFGLSDTAQIAAVEARLTPHPLGAYNSPLHLKHPLGNGLPAVYVHCTRPSYAGLAASRAWVAASGMAEVELAACHDAMISSPHETAALLERLASAPGSAAPDAGTAHSPAP